MGGGGVEGRCLPATSRLASVTFKRRNVFIKKTHKNFEVITEILFRFPGFGDFKIPVVIENQNVQWCNVF